MRQHLKSFFLTLILAASSGAVGAPIGHESDRSGSTTAPAMTGYFAAQRGGMSLNEAVEQVRRQYNGRIVSAETRMNGNQEMHHIKVLTDDGKVKTVKIPGRTRGSG